MQTTLLGIGIALILALVAALVGPYFVDWSRYRPEFEAQTSRLTGLHVRIRGDVAVQLLPTPILTLQQVEIARQGDAGALRAKSLGIEFSLSALMRGEWRASQVRLDGADFTVAVDGDGRLDWPVPTIVVDPDSVSIQRLDIVNSRALMADVTSGAHLLIEKLEFRGELRSLVGPVKGEGSFVVDGRHYPYRLSASRAGDNSARVRLNLDPTDRPLTAEADALIVVERGAPRFEGSLQVSLPGAPTAGTQAGTQPEPWRVTTRIRGDARAAVFEQIELQYGPDERAIKMRGDANLTFGRTPQLAVALASAQVDLDRVLALPDATRKRPMIAVKAFADAFRGAQLPPIPVTLGISVENVVLAGATLQRVSGEITADAQSWNLDVLDFRAPGATQVGLSGRLNVGASGIAFDGRAKVEARDPRALVAWLSDRADTRLAAAGVLRAQGNVRLGSDTIAIDDLAAELDRMTLSGRLAYSWPDAERPARIDAALSAPDVDFDRAHALIQDMFGDTAFAVPREGKLALKIGRAAVGGVEANQADVDVQFDRHGLQIERLAIGDFGGAAIAVKGSIDTRGRSPRGSVTFDLDARALDGAAALIEKFAPQAAVEFRRRAGRFVPAKMRATLVVNTDPPGAGSAPAGTVLTLDGKAGAFRITMQGSADGGPGGFTIASLPRLDEIKLNLSGRLDADEGTALVELLGLDPLLAVDRRPGRLSLTASGPLGGDMALDSHLIAGGLDVASKGTVRIAGNEGPTAGLAIRVVNANLRSPRPSSAGRPAEILPVAFVAKLAFADGVVGLTDITGKAAGTDVGGRLKIGVARPITIEGQIEVAEVNLPSVIAAATGTPLSGDNAATAWPTEPFEQGLLGGISGQVAVRSAHVTITPRHAAKNVRGVLHFDQSELGFEELDGTFVGGRVAGEMTFHRGADGVTAHTQLRFAGADFAEIVRGGPPPLAGRLTLDVTLDGTGRSPAALIGALKGSGTFTLQDGRAVRLNPAAFDAVIQSVDQGLPIDAARIRERMEQALNTGALSIPLAEGEVAIADGRARLANTIVRAEGVDITVAGSAQLGEQSLDMRLIMAGPVRPDSPGGLRPEISVALKGPVDAVQRTIDVGLFSNWLALRVLEQQTKRIDALEANRESAAQPPAAATPPPATTAPATNGPTTNAPAATVPPAQAAPPRARTIQVVPETPPAAVPNAGVPKRRAATPPASNSGSAQPLDLRPPVARSGSIFDGAFSR